jgi:hypothetical protein
MSDKSFGARRINLIGGEEVPNITSQNDLNIIANKVAISTDLGVGKSVTALDYYGDGVNLVGIVTNLLPGIGIDLFPNQTPGNKGEVKIQSYRPIGKTIYVSQTGNDNNTGLTENHTKRTIKAAAACALSGDTIKVFPGVYVEENPIVLAKTVAVEGTELRNCVITPKFANLDLFHVNNGCHITDVSFISPYPMIDGAAIVAFEPLLGTNLDRYFDGARMIRLNLDYIARETVGFLTSGFSGFAGSNREQDAARLIDKNLNYIAAEAVGFLSVTQPNGFVIPSGDYQDCQDDVKDIFRAVSYDLKANGNRKSVGAALSYFSSSGALLHVTGIATQQATIATLNYAVGIAKSVINNVSPPISYQAGITSIPQVKDLSVIQVAGGCVGVGNTISQLVGIVTTAIGAGTTASIPTGNSIRFGIKLESDTRIQELKKIWKGVCFDITRGGNSKSVKSGESYLNEDKTLNSAIFENTKEVQQTISAIDYSYNIARAVINNATWGGYSSGIATAVINAEYDPITGITTITAINHGLEQNDAVKIKDLEFSCHSGSPGFEVGIQTAVYNRLTGITTITTTSPLSIASGDRIYLRDLVFECNSGGGPSTAYFPSGNYGYDFTVLDRLEPNKFVLNVGTSTLDHDYIEGGTAAKLYTPIFGVSTAVYDNTTGITTITTVGIGTTTGAQMYIEPGKKVRLDNLVFECDSGGGPSTAYFPSGANGYTFEVISTADDRYVDASNLIKLNRKEIIDKSLAAVAIGHSDFYFPGDPQTTRFSRFRDAYRLIQNNKDAIVTAAWNQTAVEYPGIVATETKCKRDLGYFIDAISTDIFTGGNSYTIEFVKQYFNANGTLLLNGLDGEVNESNYAFVQARDLMKDAITNTLAVASYADLTITADPATGSNTSENSCANVQSAINTLTGLTTSILSAGSLDILKFTAVNEGIFVGGENKCRRDIGYIVDALINDVKYGTNKYTREAIRAYFNSSGTPISNGLVGEEGPSVTAFEAVRYYSIFAMTNNLNKKDLSITADPDTGSNTSLASCADVASNITNLIQPLKTAITNGNLNSYPTLYTSNKIKVNVGVSSIPHTYIDGGTVIQNYTTNKFPDGTYNYIFPVESVVGPNTFSFISGQTFIPHMYENGGTVQKYVNYQNEITQVKDLGMQPDPDTGSNRGINGCANVTSAIRSCVGIVTTIVGLNTAANIKINYPGNRGDGFETVLGVSTASYDELSGKATISVPGIKVRRGDIIEVRNLVFSCPSGGTPTTQIFPSGRYGYEFYVDKINSDGSLEINVGVSTIPHVYVSGGHVVNRSVDILDATYENTTGITTIYAPGGTFEVGDVVTLRDLEFSCNSGAGTTVIYPTGNEGFTFNVISVNPEMEEFTVRVGTSTIPHTYVAGGIVIPPYSRGVGQITQGPYIRNCTNFVADSIGMRVNGFDAEPGDADDIGVTGSMSVDSFTQYNQGGIGVSITNGAYSQLVSIFTICNNIAIFTATGGQCDLTNSNASFGNFGLYSVGVGDNTSKSIYRYTGVIEETAPIETDTIVVSGVGTNRPYDGQALYFGELYNFVQTIVVDDPGFGYTPGITPRVVVDLPEGPSGIRAEASANVDRFGRVTSIDVISTGSQYKTIPNVTVDPPPGGGGQAAQARATVYPIYYTIESATKPVSGISTIVLNTTLNNTVGTGSTVYFSRLSLQIATTISFEWIGAGTNINTAKPALGGLTNPDTEVVKLQGGQVVYTSTNQAGNFKIGDDITVNQLTGTITGRSFDQSLLNTITPLIIALGN